MSSIADLTPAPGLEGARRATGDTGARGPLVAPDPEVAERAKRRRFTAEYKLRILREADACKGDGDLGALLRREGLYSSHLATWRRQRDEIAKAGLKARKRGPKSKAVDPRVKQLERENLRLKRRLEQAETIIDFQKKLSKLLGIQLNSPDSDGND
jgi:transposase